MTGPLTDDQLAARVLAAKVSRACAHGGKVCIDLELGVVLVLRDGVSPSAAAWFAGYLAQAGHAPESVRRIRGTAWRAFRDLLARAHADLDALATCRDMRQPMSNRGQARGPTGASPQAARARLLPSNRSGDTDTA